MSLLVKLEKISLAFGLDHLLNQENVQINSGERICLIGRNGAGKSSLMKIIEGRLIPDNGMVWRKPSLRLARLSQELPSKTNETVYEYVAEGLKETGQLLAQYHEVVHHLSHGNHEAKNLERLEKLQHSIDACDGWQLSQMIDKTLTRLNINPDWRLNELSGGWQRRCSLAKAFVASPDLLLLDEPTNHLDIEAIIWLEEQLLASKMSILFITHDRSLLQRLATRIIELDRGNLTSWPGDYNNFLKQKEALLQAEMKLNAQFDKKLAQEEVWIRKGIQARRTRNEGRVRALKSLRQERSKRRELQGKANFSINQEDKSGKMVIEAKHITHSFDNKVLIKDFSIEIMRGDRIGFLGANGVGKSTLLSILLGKLTPQQGQVKQGTRLKIAYFDQLRSELDLEKTVIDNLTQGSEEVEVNGQKKHVISYLRDFLFTPEQARTAAKVLSGGECNRLLLARLFSQPANLLVLDEPTNDLDIETLELLEELLSQFNGTLLIVSHDRAFLNNIVTSTVAFEGNGQVSEYIGGYDDWLRLHASTPEINQSTETSDIKLSHHNRKELSKLLAKIEKLEAKQQKLQECIAHQDFYQQPAELVSNTLLQLEEVNKNLEVAYTRWHQLENS